MKHLFTKLACITFGTCVFATAAIAQTPVSPPGSWPYAITTPGSYRLTANMLPPAATSAITINANNVTLDLNGFTVSQGGLVPLCNPDTATGYGSTCSSVAAPALIDANGRNITIKNGIVTNGPGPGILLDGGLPTVAQNATFEDLKVNGNRGNGIAAAGEGNRFVRVDALYNAGTGVIAGAYPHLEDVSANWNDSVGISSSGFGNSHRIIVRANGQMGFFGNGVVDHMVVQANHSSGFAINGVVSNVVSRDNTFSDGVDGILLDSNFSTGDVSVTGCYAQTAANTFLGTGVPMTSNTCP